MIDFTQKMLWVNLKRMLRYYVVEDDKVILAAVVYIVSLTKSSHAFSDCKSSCK